VLLFLDTTVLIDHLRGRPAAERVTALAERGVRAATTAINIEEIVRGLRPPEEVAAQHLASGLIVMPITAEAVDRWHVAPHLRGAGQDPLASRLPDRRRGTSRRRTPGHG